jgi:hypothetical protein
MRIKVSKLQGSALDYAVAIAEGWGEFEDMAFCAKEGNFAFYLSLESYQPSTNWAHGGPIIEMTQMDFRWVGVGHCRASIEWLDEDEFEEFGPTPLIAAMRCYVASKLGEEVEVPDEILN